MKLCRSVYSILQSERCLTLLTNREPIWKSDLIWKGKVSLLFPSSNFPVRHPKGLVVYNAKTYSPLNSSTAESLTLFFFRHSLNLQLINTSFLYPLQFGNTIPSVDCEPEGRARRPSDRPLKEKAPRIQVCDTHCKTGWHRLPFRIAFCISPDSHNIITRH